ncbi:alpha/beta hydrolase family protein [Aldersonia sp. NBC_00410]|uniref:alpha/beta hydrolase n=1 Tax=Aldersonia sp. NBC_00410 TaxID=2975954 RepID=UPI0022593287|nr:alpha/beta hydrolase [Aldersonia sp. NBC_00410]MCX5042131.1 alpha/beta hydrolase family protein [Aldersonia sp. NBC_00410]
MTITRVRRSTPRSMVEYAHSLCIANRTFTDRVECAHRAVDDALLGWRGAAASAAQARAQSERRSAGRVAAAVLAISDEFATYGAELDGYREALLRIVDVEAPIAGMMVADDGAVIAIRGPFDSGTPRAGSELDSRAAFFASRIAEQLARFEAAEQRAARQIAIAVAELATAPPERLGAAVHAIVDGRAELPRDPTELHQLWTGLTPDEKDALYAHDNYLGNRDGLPAADRDRYNGIKLGDELTRARAGEPALAARLADLQAVHDTLALDPNRMLLLLDTASGAQTHAAVAVGDPDTAGHVSVTTPGLNTTVGGSLAGMVDEADRLKRAAEFALRSTADHRAESVAAIAWIGYDPPQLDADLVAQETVDGALDAAGTHNARAGAPYLARFYDGIAAAHDGGDQHLVAIGHSYGSLVTGLALLEPGPHVVDDLLVYGSPGVGTGHGFGDTGFEALHIAPGHAFEMTAHDDPIAHLNRFGWSPGYRSDFTHLDTDATTTPDGVPRDGATGHGEYPRSGANGELRTSGYYAAVILAGLPELAVRGDPALVTGRADLFELVESWIDRWQHRA